MLVQNDVIPYINNLLSIGRQFPYDRIGKLLADLVPRVFESSEFSTFIKVHSGQTHVIPVENIQTYPPFWNPNKLTSFRTRRDAQLESIKFLKNNPTIYVSCDGGLFSPTDFTNNISMIRQSAVIQTPLLMDKVINVKSSTMPPDTSNLMDPSIQMTVTELRIMYCMINSLKGKEPNCDKIGCQWENCPVKKINFNDYLKIIEENGCKIVGFLDRPVCANYLRIMGNEVAEIMSIYGELLNFANKNDVALISVKQSSNHKALTRTIIDTLAGGIPANNSFMMEPLIDFLNENKDFADISNLDSHIRTHYKVNNPTDFIQFLNEQWKRGFLSNILIDYSIFKHIIKEFEFRSNAFILKDYYLQRNYPDTKFQFFFVNYGDDWGRVEYINAEPEIAATHYYLQTAIGRYYPLIIKIAHERAVMARNYQTILKRILRISGLSHPTLKSMNKVKK